MTIAKILKAMDLEEMQPFLDESGLTKDTLLTKENYEDYIAKEKAFYTSYDYDQLFGEQQ